MPIWSCPICGSRHRDPARMGDHIRDKHPDRIVETWNKFAGEFNKKYNLPSEHGKVLKELKE